MPCTDQSNESEQTVPNVSELVWTELATKLFTRCRYTRANEQAITERIGNCSFGDAV